MSNSQSTGCMRPGMPMNAAQHKIVIYLKHYLIFLWLRVAVSCKINVSTLSLFVHLCGFSFTAVCRFQCVIFQAQTVQLTPSDVTCACDDSAIISNISTYHCNVRHLMLFRSQVSILTWLLKVLPNVGGASHVIHHTLQSPLHLGLYQQSRGLWKSPNLAFYFSVNSFS